MEDQHNIEMAKLAEHAERFSDMADFMKSFITARKKLTEEQRNLFSVAYKNLVGGKRTAWRVLNSVGSKQDPEKQSQHKSTLLDYRKKVEVELKSTCEEVIGLLEDLLMEAKRQRSVATEDGADTDKSELYAAEQSIVFYHKMKGDYYRYMCEVEEGSNKKVQESSACAYKEAVDSASAALKSTDPIRLGLALNYSVFLYEIIGNQPMACDHAKTAFDDAISHLDELDEKQYKDSTLIMQLLRDNLTLWNNDGDAAAGEEQTQQDEN